MLLFTIASSQLALPVVTGGTLTSDSTYYYRTFTTDGTLTVSNAPLNAKVLIVGGGGSGHAYGGGGAGGYIAQDMTLNIGSYPAVVGLPASNSSFNSQIAYAGNSVDSFGLIAQNGAASGAPTSYAGGLKYTSLAGGGGGGSSAAGQNGRTNDNNGIDGIGGLGGAGTQWINGITYAAGGNGAGNWAGGSGDNSGGQLGNGGNSPYAQPAFSGQKGIVIVAYLKSEVGG